MINSLTTHRSLRTPPKFKTLTLNPDQARGSDKEALELAGKCGEGLLGVVREMLAASVAPVQPPQDCRAELGEKVSAHAR